MLTVVVDPERCIGCLQCEFACALEDSQARVAYLEQPPPRKRIQVAAGSSCRHGALT
jgi:carbon-monoxide dehydrogenase iron sulfur subunit